RPKTHAELDGNAFFILRSHRRKEVDSLLMNRGSSPPPHVGGYINQYTRTRRWPGAPARSLPRPVPSALAGNGRERTIFHCDAEDTPALRATLLDARTFRTREHKRSGFGPPRSDIDLAGALQSARPVHGQMYHSS